LSEIGYREIQLLTGLPLASIALELSMVIVRIASIMFVLPAAVGQEGKAAQDQDDRTGESAV